MCWKDRVATAIATPQDDEILRLGNELNQTYISYGRLGELSKQRQSLADSSSAKMSKKVAIERMQLKSKKAYDNRNWDLVDRLENDGKFLETAKDEELPAELRGKTVAEKTAAIEGYAKKRAELKKKIGELEAQRAAFIAADQAKNGDKNAPSLDTELMKSTKKAAAKKGYK